MPSLPSAVLQDELRLTLDAASLALRRLLHERVRGMAAHAAAAAGGEAEPSLDAAPLRDARDRLLHCAAALEPVGGSSKLLYAMASLMQSYAAHPQACSEASAGAVERASDAVIEHLAALALGRHVSAVALFPQYRELLMLLGEERVHPAELWTPPATVWQDAPVVDFPLEGAQLGTRTWAWIDGTQTGNAARAALKAEPMAYAPALRSRMDVALLQMVKAGGGAAALPLRDIALGLAAGESTPERRAFWQLAAAYFEALALELIAADIYVKRTASRVLLQYTAFSRALPGAAAPVADGLAQDLLFFCAQAAPPNLRTAVQAAPVLATMRRVYGLADAQPVNYEAQRYGRFDPTALAQARQRIRAALEGWAAFNTEPDLLYPNSIPDHQRYEALTALFSQLGVSLLTLQPERREMVRALLQAADYIARTARAPDARLATEMDLALCFLDTAYEDLDPAEDMLKQERSDLLALRIDRAVDASDSRMESAIEPLEPWMADLLGLELAPDFRPDFRPEPVLSDMVPWHEPAQARAPESAWMPEPEPEPELESAVVQEPALAPEPVPKLESEPEPEFTADLPPGIEAAQTFAQDIPDPVEAMAPAGDESPLAPASTPVTDPEPEPVFAQTLAREISHEQLLDTARQAVHEGLDAVAVLLSSMFDADAATANTESIDRLRQIFERLAQAARADTRLAEADELADAAEALLPLWSDASRQDSSRPEVLHLVLDALHQIGLWVEDAASGRASQPLAEPLRQAVVAAQLEAGGATDHEHEAHEFADSGESADSHTHAASPEPVLDLDALVSEPAQFAEPTMGVASAEREPPPFRQARFVDGEALFKQVGRLRLPLADYKAFLNEADEWSRLLSAGLNEWSLDVSHQVRRALPVNLLALAHALAGSAAGLGLEALAVLARTLEQAMMQLRGQYELQAPAAEAARIFMLASEDIRYLLHQLAAGQLKMPEPGLLDELAAVAGIEAPILLAPDSASAAFSASAQAVDAALSDEPDLFSSMQGGTSGPSAPQGVLHNEWGYAPIPDAAAASPSALNEPAAPVQVPHVDARAALSALPLRQRVEARLDEVHGGLHELDLMLERLRTHLKAAGLPPEALKEIGAVQRHLQEALGELEDDLRDMDDGESAY